MLAITFSYFGSVSTPRKCMASTHCASIQELLSSMPTQNPSSCCESISHCRALWIDRSIGAVMETVVNDGGSAAVSTGPKRSVACKFTPPRPSSARNSRIRASKSIPRELGELRTLFQQTLCLTARRERGDAPGILPQMPPETISLARLDTTGDRRVLQAPIRGVQSRNIDGPER